MTKSLKIKLTVNAILMFFLVFIGHSDLRAGFFREVWEKNFKGHFVKESIEDLSEAELKLVGKGKVKKVNGMKVVQSDHKIDPNKKDAKGRTNCERMKEGNAPLGEDNKPIELHHAGQKNDGPIIELTHTEHKENDGELHDKTKPSEIDRKWFDAWRRAYWMQRSLELCM